MSTRAGVRRGIMYAVVGACFIGTSLWHVTQPVPVAIAYFVTTEAGRTLAWVALLTSLAGGVLLAAGRCVGVAASVLLAWLVAGAWLRGNLPESTPCGCLPWGLDQSAAIHVLFGGLTISLAWIVIGERFTLRRAGAVAATLVVGCVTGIAIASSPGDAPVAMMFSRTGTQGTLRVENRGSVDVVIEEVRPLCDCLKIDVRGRAVIPPGRTYEYDVGLVYTPDDLETRPSRGVLVRGREEQRSFSAITSVDISALRRSVMSE